MIKVILNKKRTFRGYTRYSDKYFKGIFITEQLLCDVDARKCPFKGKAKEKQWCQWVQMSYLKKGDCRKVEIIIEEKTHIIINKI